MAKKWKIIYTSTKRREASPLSYVPDTGDRIFYTPIRKCHICAFDTPEEAADTLWDLVHGGHFEEDIPKEVDRYRIIMLFDKDINDFTYTLEVVPL